MAKPEGYEDMLDEATPIRKRRSAADVEFEVESRYKNRCGCCGSLMGEVSSHHAELVDEFWRWRSQTHEGGPLVQAVALWMQERYDSRKVHPGAVGLMAAYAKASLQPGEKESRDPSRPRLSPQERERRFYESLGREVVKHEWPENKNGVEV